MDQVAAPKPFGCGEESPNIKGQDSLRNQGPCVKCGRKVSQKTYRPDSSG